MTEFNPIEPITDKEVLVEALKEIRAVWEKYKLSGFFYLTQPGNMASTEWFFQEQIWMRMNEMPNVVSDLSSTVPAATRILMKAILRNAGIAKVFVKPWYEQDAQDDTDQAWAESLDKFMDGLEAKIVVGSPSKDWDIADVPKSEEELRQMAAAGLVNIASIQEAKANWPAVKNRLQQIRNAVVWDYYGSKKEVDSAMAGSTVADMLWEQKDS